jgi:hypothetical protein
MDQKPPSSFPAAPPSLGDLDMGTPQGPVRAIYRLLSGAAGQARDWERFRGFFTADGRMMPLRGRDGAFAPESLAVDEYVRSRTPVLAGMDFYEDEIACRTEVFGDLAHVLSSYQARRSPGGPPFMRGVNSIQLVRQDGRWLIASVIWDTERPDNPLPDSLRGDGR